MAELLAIARTKTCAPRTSVLVVASLALAAEWNGSEGGEGFCEREGERERRGRESAIGDLATCEGSGLQGEDEAGQGWVEVSAEALREAVGVVAMVDRSCRHTPLQQSLHLALLRLLAASSSPSISVSGDRDADGYVCA